jgi:hypothetical protein
VRGLRLRCVIVIVVAIALGASPAAGEQTRRERVAFESRAASTTLKGAVAGYDTVDDFYFYEIPEAVIVGG